MIIIKLKGGRGNQLFQYAFGRLLSLKLGVDIKYSFSNTEGDTQIKYELGYFNTNVQIATDNELKKIRYPYGIFSKFKELFKTKTNAF